MRLPVALRQICQSALICSLMWATPMRAEVLLSATEAAEAASPNPLLDRRLGRVTLSIQAPCLTCGDSLFFPRAAAVESRFTSDFLNELKSQLRQNGILNKEANQRLALHVNVVKVSHDNTAGAAAQRANPITNGGTQVSSITMEYVLSDGDVEIFRQSLSSKGRSNSLGAADGSLEALDASLKKNLRVFLLSLKGALDPSFAPRAQQLAVQISDDDPTTRSFLGYLVVGMAHVGVGAAKVAEGTLEVLGSDAMASALDAASVQMRENQRQLDRIQHQAMLATVNSRANSSHSSYPTPGSSVPRATEGSATRPPHQPNAAQPARSGSPSAATTGASSQQPRPQANQFQTPAAVDLNTNRPMPAVTAVADVRTARAQNATSGNISATGNGQRGKTEAPDDRPRVGGPPNKDGCWIPDRSKPMCMVVVSEENRKGTMRVVYRNDCQWGIYANYENERTNGSWDAGADNLRPGEQKAWSTPEATGRYRFNFTGSDRSRSDWVCAGEDAGLKAWNR